MTKDYEDIFYKSADGLTLYARDYGPRSGKPPALCMHGLSRNSADFHDLAIHLKDRFRIISVDQRGRGRSDYDPNTDNYRADVYSDDMFTLLRHLDLETVTAIGTSMGGIITMMMAAMKPGIFNGAILNDIGPEIDPAGLERIKAYIGQSGPFANWDAAVAALKAQGQDIFPDYARADWLAFAKRTCTDTENDGVRFAYDPAIAKPFKDDETAAAPVDMWPIFLALADIPVLSIRGALSDLFSANTAEKMALAHERFTRAEIPRVGHAPMLNEPESFLAIDSFMEIFT